MATVVCDNINCTYRSKNKFCMKDFVFINKFTSCNEWFSDQGVPYREQMSEYLRKEFEAYDKRNINNTKDNMATAENDTTDDTNSSSNGESETANEEIKETEEEVIE